MLEELLKRIAELEKMAERSADQDAELSKARAKVSDLEERAKKSEDNEAELKEMKRKEAIREAGEKYGASADVVRTFLDDTTKTDQDLKDKLLEERKVNTPDITVQVGDINNKDELLRAVGDAVAARMGVSLDNPHKDVEMFRGASLLDIAKAVTGSTGYNKEQIAERAMVSADFPNLLLGSGNRMLEAEFDAANTTYEQFVQFEDVQDFRSNTDITIGKGGRLDKLKESGELKQKSLAEGAETWSLESFGNEFILTRKMIINDDLGAFMNMLALFGEMAAQTANGRVYDLLMKRGDYASYVMSDAKAIFHADHSNLASAALSSTALAAGRAAMRKHKGIDGKTPLNINAYRLHVGPDLEQTAYELINSIAKVEDNKSSGVANFHRAALDVIVDAEITGSQWFLSAQRRGIKVGRLAGTGGRPTLKMNDASITKTIFEGVFDFGVVASDYRGLYAGNGTA